MMTEDVFVSITGLHAAPDEPEEEIEVIFPGKCRKTGDTWCIQYSEPVEGMDGEIRNLIKLRDHRVEVTKRGLTSTHMVFEEGKKNVTWYETPLGSIELGIAATNVQIVEDSDTIIAQAVYALEINQTILADCSLSISVRSKNTAAGRGCL